MKVLVACEFSGVIRDAFKANGHDAWSCDLLPTEMVGNHIVGDVLEVLRDGWDLLVAHPPCTHLAVSGARHFKKKRKVQIQALDFFLRLLNAPIVHVAVENPVGLPSSAIGPPSQIIQPWQFGHGECKATCLWLKNLPPLCSTCIVEGREQRIWELFKTTPKDELWKVRSVTYQGVAKAMADQWGDLNYRDKGLGLAEWCLRPDWYRAWKRLVAREAVQFQNDK